MLREALLYERLEGNKVRCFLCGHHCQISDGKFGICSVRENRGGTLYTHSYGKLIAQNIDPIEKKPLYHFLPGSSSFSIAVVGCNFQCGFCQNWQISQVKEARALGLRSEEVEPEEVVKQARRAGSKSISYTYTEPTIFFEYALETGQLAKKEGFYNAFVTNGYMTEEMIRMAHPWLDAANIDLKSFNDDYYRTVCKGRLAPVLKSIELMKKLNIWLEVTTLIVPGQNDSQEELKKIAEFLAGVDPSIPWHISRFYPQYKMEDLGSTPMKTMDEAYGIGKEAGLRYVYLGNVMGKGSNTHCYHCNLLLIERSGFAIHKYRVKEGKCPECQTPMDGMGL
ncbi:MAG TPA: AmmeMemoRadiSam system radical SAM enzyme [Thermodesulfobacteriota bacterium]|nr:AmmeMemoRadiSam system radical SAM enzyme [Thermodesulfobacteriota bacterium]